MVICDNCPLIQSDSKSSWFNFCSITRIGIKFDVHSKKYLGEDCPLKRIELKDGTVYEPEVKE